MFVKGIKENFDLWSIVHFLGPFFLCYVIGPVWATVALVGWVGGLSFAKPSETTSKCILDNNITT